MNKRRIACVCVLTAALTPPLFAQQWKFLKQEKNLKIAMVAEPRKSGSAKSNTILILQCRPGENGTMSVMYRINDTKRIQDFQFDDFEGPDAPASKENFFSVKVESTRVPLQFAATAGGWYVVDDDFLFSFTAVNGRNSNMKRLIDALQAGAKTVTVQVRDSRNPKKTLYTTFPAPTDLAALKETLAGCR